jgi:hypothetical protein
MIENVYRSACKVPVIVRRTGRDIIKMYIGLHVKYRLFMSDCNESFISAIDFRKKYRNINFHENLSSGSRTVPCRQTERHG